MNRETVLYNTDREIRINRRDSDMKTLLNRIYNTENQYRTYNNVLEKGWSFMGQNISGKDSRVLFM